MLAVINFMYIVDEEMSGMEEKVERCLLQCVFGFLTNLFQEFTVHACNMFTHLKLR